MTEPSTRRRRARSLAVVTAAAAVTAACIRWRPSRVEVSGDSMDPTLMPGDWLLAVPARRLRVGHVVVVGHPDRAGFEIVKRIFAGPGDVAPDGSILGADDWWIEGDNIDASTDSYRFGAVSRALIHLRIRAIYAPVARRRLL
ncbi:MAG: S26 family signal peptidase [Actinomycetota bacterium]